MADWQPIADRLSRLAASWPAPPWTWDDRFGAIAASFTIDQEPAVRTSAQYAFPRGWTLKTIETAPANLRAIVDRTGGLRARQRLLGGDELLAPALFGLWWPWAGGDKVTLRIGMADQDVAVQLRAVFGIA